MPGDPEEDKGLIGIRRWGYWISFFVQILSSPLQLAGLYLHGFSVSFHLEKREIDTPLSQRNTIESEK